MMIVTRTPRRIERSNRNTRRVMDSDAAEGQLSLCCDVSDMGVYDASIKETRLGNAIVQDLTCCEVDDSSVRSELPTIAVEVVRQHVGGIFSACGQIGDVEPRIVPNVFPSEVSFPGSSDGNRIAIDRSLRPFRSIPGQ